MPHTEEKKLEVLLPSKMTSFPWFNPNPDHPKSWTTFLAIGSVLDERLERRDYRIFRKAETEGLVLDLLESIGEQSLVDPKMHMSMETSPFIFLNIGRLLRAKDAFPFLMKEESIPLLAKAATAVLAYRSIEKRQKVFIFDMNPLFKALEIPLQQWNKEGQLLLNYCLQVNSYLTAERLEATDGEELSPVLSLTPIGIKEILGVDSSIIFRKMPQNSGEKQIIISNRDRWKAPKIRLRDLVLPGDIKFRMEYLTKALKKNPKSKFNILMYGPPGTGKTISAKALAGELKKRIIDLDLSKIHSSFVGDTEKAISKVFQEAEKDSSIIFFDEADSVIRERNLSNRSWEVSETCHLLKLIEESPASVILCTNHLEIVDSALLRRLNELLEFPLPDKVARKSIWKKECSKYRIRVDEEDLEHLSEVELSGGLIASAVKKVQMIKISQGRKLLIDGPFLMSIAQEEQRKMGCDIQPAKRKIGFRCEDDWK